MFTLMHIYDQLKLSLPSSAFGKFLLRSLEGDEIMMCIDVRACHFRSEKRDELGSCLILSFNKFPDIHRKLLALLQQN